MQPTGVSVLISPPVKKVSKTCNAPSENEATINNVLVAVCGGEFTAMQGTIKSNGYPNIATRSQYVTENRLYRVKLSVIFDLLYFHFSEAVIATGKLNCREDIT